MTTYNVRDVFTQKIREMEETPTQELVLIKIDVSKNLYRVQGVRDGLIYDYPKSYLDVFLQKKGVYGS